MHESGMTRSVNYFGFGANAHPHMIEAIIGREPHGEPAILQGYALAIQSLLDVPDTVLISAPAPVSPRAILRRSWGGGGIFVVHDVSGRLKRHLGYSLVCVS